MDKLKLRWKTHDDKSLSKPSIKSVFRRNNFIRASSISYLNMMLVAMYVYDSETMTSYAARCERQNNLFYYITTLVLDLIIHI